MTEPILHIDPYGNKMWLTGNICHRLDGPAIERADGEKVWYKNGKWHRLDGPAMYTTFFGIEFHKIWCFNGKRYNEENHPFNIFRKDYDLSKSYKKWPKDKKVLFKLTYGGDT